jgi:hypothetical protein
MPFLPVQVLEAQRDDTERTLQDRCVVLVQQYDEVRGIFSSPWHIALSGLPADLAFQGYKGSGVPVDVWDVSSLPDTNMLSMADHLQIGVQQYRMLTVPWYINQILSGVGGIRLDTRLVVGGSLSGGGPLAKWIGGSVYQVAALADDVTQPTELVLHCKKVSPGP